jgi:hypothetical protein
MRGVIDIFEILKNSLTKAGDNQRWRASHQGVFRRGDLDLGSAGKRKQDPIIQLNQQSFGTLSDESQSMMILHWSAPVPSIWQQQSGDLCLLKE